MPERIPELDRLASAAREVPVLNPAEIRRRGDRRRLTRHVAVGLGVSALVLGAGFGTVQAFTQSTPDWADPSPVPTVSTPVPSPTARPSDPSVLSGPAGPTWENMVTPQLLFTEGDIPGVVKQDSTTPDAALQGVCVTRLPGDPTTVLTRGMGLEGDEWPTLYVATVFGYVDVGQADAAFDDLVSQALACGDRLTETGHADPSTQDLSHELTLTAPAGADPARAAYSLSMAGPLEGSGSEDGLFVETTVLQTGTRVLLLTQQFEGMDYNCSVVPDPDITRCAAPAALDQMAELLFR